MINSTFGGFMTARLGLSVSQKALNITGQNITNIATEGYTRQRLDQVSLNTGNGTNRYAQDNVNIGNGALATGVSQVRDQYLDKRYRTELAKVGESDKLVAGLNELASILDESTLVDDDGGMINQLGDILAKLNSMSNNVTSKEFETMFKASADVLVKTFNTYADRIQNVRNNYEESLSQVEIPEVNSILTNIKDLNISIKTGQFNKDNCLELRDQRNLLIDKLAEYADIEVKYDVKKVSDYTYVDELTINMVNADGTKTSLIKDEQSRQFTYEKDDATGVVTIGLSELAPEDVEAETAVSGAEKTLEKEKNADTEAKAKLDELNAQLTEVNTKLTEANTAVADGEAKVTNAQNAYDTAKAAYDTARAGNDPAVIEAAKNTYNQSRDTLNEAKNTLRAAQNDVKSYQQQADSLNEKVTKADEKHKELVANKTERVDTAQANLDAAKQARDDGIAAGAEQNNINDNLKDGIIKGAVDLLNNNGEYDDPPTSKGIGFYSKMLDTLASKLATEFNNANNPTDVNGDPIDIGEPKGVAHDLFAARDGGANITASNITLAEGWKNNTYGVTNSKKGVAAAAGANDNIAHMITMMKDSKTYTTDGTATGTRLFDGTFQEFFTNIGTTLGIDIKANTEVLQNHTTLSAELSDARDNVSGVSLDEEGMNMMQYIQSYNASARMMTTLDEALDTLINKMGVVGR